MRNRSAYRRDAYWNTILTALEQAGTAGTIREMLRSTPQSNAGINRISCKKFILSGNDFVLLITAYISEVSARMDSENTEIVFTMLQMGNSSCCLPKTESGTMNSWG